MGIAHEDQYENPTDLQLGLANPEALADIMSEQELTKLVRKMQSGLTKLNAARELRREMDKAKAIPARPKGFTRFQFTVQFNPGGRYYDYLGFAAGGRVYTTGTGDDRVFQSWEAFVRWCRADDKHYVSPLHRLTNAAPDPHLPATIGVRP